MKEDEKGISQAQGISSCMSLHISWKQSIIRLLRVISGFAIVGVILCLFIGQHNKTWAQNSIYIVSDTVGLVKDAGSPSDS